MKVFFTFVAMIR